MRLEASQIRTIQDVIRQVAGRRSITWLFGSRLDDELRGGDVDLLVQSTPPITLMQRARIKSQLESQLSLPVDVMACSDEGPLSPFARIAVTQGVLL